jgi:FKBP-type peptidyl-prolyl cis-trans isomerase (trigger factor)
MSTQPTITKLERSRIEIRGNVPAEKFETYYQKALESIAKVIKVDGFRPGNAPTHVVEKQAGEPAVLDEMAQLAISDTYPTILGENNILAIGRPEIAITKIARNNDLEFTITTAVMPTVTLGDYAGEAKKVNAQTTEEPVVTQAEIDAAILEVRQMRAHQQMHDDGVDHHDHNHTNIPEDQLPEMNDEMIKKMGSFESVEDFTNKLQENLLKEKTLQIKEKKRVTLVETLVASSTVELPDMLVDFELDKMMQQFAYDISMMGMTLEDYMQRLGKTEQELKQEWRINAEKRAKLQLILDEIARSEKLEPSEAEIIAEVQKIMDMYKDSNDISEDRARAYVMQILTNGKVFEFLESK